MKKKKAEAREAERRRKAQLRSANKENKSRRATEGGLQEAEISSSECATCFDCTRMILSMASWHKSGYNAQTQSVGSGCTLIALTQIARVKCTFAQCARTYFVNQLL